MNTTRLTTSVFTPDRVGILKDVTQVVFELAGNIGSIRQTVVDGFFTLVFSADFPSTMQAATLQQALACALNGAIVTVCEAQKRPQPPIEKGSRFVVTTRGEDKPGTIYAITSFLVEHGINIEDWIVEEDEGKIVYIAQVVIPESVDFRPVQEDFRTRMSERGLIGLICHENIFRATNEIGPISALL